MDVAGIAGMDMTDEDFVDDGEQGLVDLGSTDDEDFILEIKRAQCVDRVDDFDAIGGPVFIPREDNVSAFW